MEIFLDWMLTIVQLFLRVRSHISVVENDQRILRVLSRDNNDAHSEVLGTVRIIAVVNVQYK